MPSPNAELARIFQQMADVLLITGGNRFKVNSYQRTARVIDDLITDIASLGPDELLQIDGIGKGTAERIGEFLDTGQISEHQKLLNSIPPKLPALLDVQGLGPKTLALLWQQAGVDSPEKLKQMIAEDPDQLTQIKGLGKKTLDNIAKNLAFAETAAERVHLGVALPLAERLCEALRQLPGVKRCEYAGSLRRGKETIGDVDLLVAAKPEDAQAIADAFVGLDIVADVLAHGESKSSIRTERGVQVDLRIVPPPRFGAALMYFTGSKEHNVALRERAIARDMRLNEYGLWQGTDKPDNASEDRLLAADQEEAVYEKLGLSWIAPELRENRGELKQADKESGDQLPQLIEIKDLRAELHTHTTASDGVWSIEELALAAAKRGFHTVAITDHSKGQVQANGLDERRLEKHIQAIHKVAEKLKGTIRVLAGSEVDILSGGELDYADDLLEELDVVVASPHAALSQDPDKATTRLLKAMDNPYVSIMGHPTGRLLLRREGLSPDIEKLIEKSVENNIAMEINANHYRLDLRDTHARLAIERGVMLSINTDAHGPADFDQLRYGVLTARRAGASKKQVINCFTEKKLAQWIAASRQS